MSDHLEVSLPRDEKELTAVAAILMWSFNITVDPRPWMERAGLSNLRVLREDGQAVGALFILPLGQWFGGRSVPMGGIAAVGIAPQARGRGLARYLMEQCVRELQQREVPLSTLFPSVQSLYRKVGYEVAGSRYELRIPPKAMGRLKRDATVRLMTEDDRAAVLLAYQSFARHHNGVLDRSPYLWVRVERPRGGDAIGFVVERKEKLEGYVYVQQQAASQVGHSELTVTDMVALTPQAAVALLAFFADHGTLTDAVRWYCGPSDPMMMLLTEPDYFMRLRDHWMVRVVDVEATLTARRYLATASGELHLEVRDDLLPNNHGRFVLKVAEGRANVKRGGKGSVALDIRDLAAMYTGFAAPYWLRACGRLQASDKDVRAATSIFCGPPPWMPDMF